MYIFDENMGDLEANRNFTKQVFETYDLDYEIERIEVEIARRMG